MNFINIKGEKISAVISTFGAELFSLKNSDGLEYLWQGDEKYWVDRSPTLFPYIGRLFNGKYIYNKKEYSLPIHGFAPTSEFEVKESAADYVIMVLRSSDETLKDYPFDFEFRLTYKICGDSLQINCEVENLSKETMHFGYGGHPGINVPLEDGLAFEDYCLEFEEDLSPRQITFSENKFVDGDAPYTLNEQNQIPLTHPMFDNDAIVLKNAGHKVTLKSDKGIHGVEATYPDMDYIGFWQACHTDAPYVCIEPWSSLPSNEDGITVLDKQNNLIALDSGKTYQNSWSLRLF